MPDPAAAPVTRLRTAGLSPRKPTRLRYVATAADRDRISAELGLIALYHLELTGEIAPAGRDALLLGARLVARVDQACVVSLAPVPAQIDEPVRRRYVLAPDEPQGDEVEMPEDDSIEALPEVIDLAEIAAEALMLALPLYPRAPGAEFASHSQTPEGAQPITDADVRPFAALRGLADQLKRQDKPDPEGQD